LKKKGTVIIVISIVFIVFNIGFDIFTHSTVERVIRTDLFFQGYFVKAFKTEISERAIPDSRYGTMYICRNPAIGPDSYDVDSKYKYFGKLKYWYINPSGTGGG
jgi:hypothetical protein